MKKVLLLLLFMSFLTFCGCSEKTPATADNFAQTMQNAGYTIHDISSQYDPALAESVTVAIKDDYQVEFYVLTSEANAAASFAKNKSNLEPLAGGAAQTSVTAANYSSYKLTTKDQYYAVLRVGNTMIYLHIPKEQKKTVSELIKSLGY